MTLEGPCRVLLVGMMGSGKSTIGRLLADATGWPYADNDELVARRARREPSSPARRAGRGGHATRRVRCARRRAGPPGTGDRRRGRRRDPQTRPTAEALRDGGIVVWLRAAAEVLAERAAGADHRPWLDADPVAWMSATLAEREPLYGSVADRVVDTDAMPPESAAAALLAWLRAETACAPALTVRSSGPS